MEEIVKKIIGYAYPRNGNVGNPTPFVRWEVYRDGVLIDAGSRLRDLRVDHPTAKVVKEVSH